MSQSALTPEEWANLRSSNVDPMGGGVLVSFVAMSPSLPDKVYLATERADGRSTRHVTAIPEALRAPTAALCLHGRITWEMVDALRAARYGNGVDGEWLTEAEGARRAHTNAVANLLESMLPPRQP